MVQDLAENKLLQPWKDYFQGLTEAELTDEIRDHQAKRHALLGTLQTYELALSELPEEVWRLKDPYNLALSLLYDHDKQAEAVWDSVTRKRTRKRSNEPSP